MAKGGNALRCALFSVTENKGVTYDEVFTGRIVYEACAAMDPSTFSNFLNRDFSHLCGISAQAEHGLTEAFEDPLKLTRGGRRHGACCRAAVCLSISVLARCHPVCIPFVRSGRILNSFIDAICDIKGDCSLGYRLPPFLEFLSRWQSAVDIILESMAAGTLSVHDGKLTQEQGNAWRGAVSPSPSAVQLPLMEASDCYDALAPLADHIQELLLRDYVDVQLGYTAPQPTKPTSIRVEAVEAQFGDVKARPLGIYGDFLSPDYVRRFKHHVFEELSFAESPSGN